MSALDLLAKLPDRILNAAGRRVLLVWQLLAKERVFNAARLARELECSPKTIHRAIEMLKAEFDAPIHFDFHRNTYYLNGEAEWPFNAQGGAQ